MEKEYKRQTNLKQKEIACDKNVQPKDLLSNVVVVGKHYPEDKNRYWRVPNNLVDKIAVGDFAYAKTRFGKHVIKIIEITELCKCEIKPTRSIGNIPNTVIKKEKARIKYLNKRPLKIGV